MQIESGLAQVDDLWLLKVADSSECILPLASVVILLSVDLEVL